MPVSTTFNPKKPIETTEAILREFFLDYFSAASYIITFEPPANPTKPTLWLQKMPSRNRDPWRTRKPGKTVQREDYLYMVSVLSTDRTQTIRMADIFKGAVLASASNLGTAGLRYVEAMPFQDVLVNSQPNSYRWTGMLRCTVQLDA